MTVIDNAMWTEKYRPETLDEVVGQEMAVRRFKMFLDPQQGGGLPHCLLHGPPGTGKTVVATAWAREFYGDSWQANFREFNASDDRGIDVVREKIKGWAGMAPRDGAPYKVIFLDEADQLTTDAQPALRRTMEEYADTTRFILTCNYINQIIDPLQSRCASFKFGRLDDEQIGTVVDRVIEQEDITVEGSARDQVVRAADGKARDAIMILSQSTMDGELTEEMVESVTGVVDRALVREIFEEALAGDHESAMERLDVEILKEGASPDLLVQACFEVLKELDLPEDSRVKCFELLADIDQRIRQGLNPHVQFHALLGHVWAAQGLSVYEQQGGA